MACARKVALISDARCSGCGRCIAVCPLPLIAFETHAWRKTAVLQDAERCTGCGKCAVHCPTAAITLTTTTAAPVSPPRAAAQRISKASW
jgi:Fe-S-cluster-containing hydrogenase component 2